MFHTGLYRGNPSLREFVLPRSSLRHLYRIRQTSSPAPSHSRVMWLHGLIALASKVASPVVFINIFPPYFCLPFCKKNLSHFPIHLVGQASPRFSHKTFL